MQKPTNTDLWRQRMQQLGDLIERICKDISTFAEQQIPLVHEKRKELAQLLLGPSFFGNETFFRYYSAINFGHHTLLETNPEPEQKRYQFTYKEDPQCQILYSTFYRYSLDSHLALVRATNASHSDLYWHHASPGSDLGSVSTVTIESVRTTMCVISLDKLAGTCNGLKDSDKLFSSFCGMVVSASTLLLAAYEKEREAVLKKYATIEEDIGRLRAVADIRSR